MTMRHCLLVAIAGAAFGLPTDADAVDPRNPRPQRDYRTERISLSTTPSSPQTLPDPGFGYNIDPTYGYDPFSQPALPSQGGNDGFSPLMQPEQPAMPSAPAGRGRGIADNGVQPYLDPTLNPTAPVTAPKKNRWRIGIRSQDSDSGVRVMRVLAGSPAAQAGLEPEDKIVAVGGYQVGVVNGQRFDLGNEFDLRCDEDGTTFLLVQNHRDGQLVTLPAQLEPRFSTVGGEIVWKAMHKLPREAYAVVELREIVRPGTRPITIADQTIHGLKQTTQTGKVPFEIEFDPAEIQDHRQYVVYSQITDGYRTLYHTMQQYPVITQRNPRRVEVQMAQIYDWTGGQQAHLDSTSREWDTFTSLFKKYMGRPLRPDEAYMYRTDFERGFSLDDALVDVIAAPEFYERCNANDRAFITRVYQMRTGRQPNEQELRKWVSILQAVEQQHRPFARELLTQLN